MESPRVNIPERFNAAAFFVDRNVEEGRGRKVALFCEDRVVTYEELQKLVNRVGNALLDLGVEREQRVLLSLPDCPEFIACFFGAVKIGAVPVPINTMARAPDIRYFLEDARAQVTIVARASLAELKGAIEGARYPRHLVVLGEAERGISFHRWAAQASPDLQAADTSRDDVAFWLYSSGSTGPPKAAVHLQHDMLVCSDTYALQILGIREADRALSAAKLYFAYGLGNSMYFPLRAGAQAVLHPDRPTAEAMFQAIQLYRPTIFFGVPTLYATMLQVEDAEERFDLSSLRLCVSAGEALPAELYRRWKARFGLEVLDGIGTTEGLHIFISNRPGATKPGSSGLPVPGYEAALVDDEGRPVHRGEVGSLRVRGGSIMAYYWDKPERTKAALLGPWLQTGDKYYQDDEGYFWYCGRSDDMLKVSGMWVSPIEVENTLVEHPAVLEAAVVGKMDSDGLVKPKAFVVLKAAPDDVTRLEEELKVFVKGRIAPHKYPRWVDFVPELPKTATGKVQRFKLRQQR